MASFSSIIVACLFVGIGALAIVRVAAYAFGVRAKPKDDTKLFDDWK